MPSPLSVDLCKRVVAAVAAGASCHRAAARFGVSVWSASRWSGRFRHEGQLASKLMGGDHTSKRIGRMPGRSWQPPSRSCVLFCASCVTNWLSRACRPARAACCASSSSNGISWEKGATYAAKQEREDIRAAREAWFEAQPELDPDRLVFLG